MPPPGKDDEALPPRRRIGDTDPQADAPGALDADARAAVEGYFPCNPDLAGQAMTVLHMRGRTELGVRGVATLAEALDPAARTNNHLAARLPKAAA